MKFAITLFSAFMFFLVTKGQPAARAEKNKSDHSFNLAIQIISDHPLKDSLTIIFSRNETFTGAFYDGAYCVTPLNGTIPFEMHVKEVHYIGRLTLYSREINNSYLPVNQMVEPGDNIKIEIRVKEDGTSTIEFSGHGSSKYSLGKMAEGVSLAKKDLRLQAALRKKSTAQVVMQYDSLLTEHINLLNAFRNQLSPQVYEVWKADAIGETRNQQLRVLSLAYSTSDSVNKQKWKKEIDRLLEKSKVALRARSVGLSGSFIAWEYEKTKWSLVYERNKNYKPREFASNNDSFGFADLYKKLKSNYAGPLRENLLVYGLLNSHDINIFFGGCAPEEFTWCLKDAAQLIKSHGLKSLVREKLEKFGRGAPVFNFQLTDASGGIVRASDFKGKTMLVEIWSIECSACHDFVKEFERKIYPRIKDRNDINVVSFCTETDKALWLKGTKKYSLPGFINLYSEKGPRDPFTEYYSLSYYPFILLVDESGRIISSTVQNCDKLIELLRQTFKLSN